MSGSNVPDLSLSLDGMRQLGHDQSYSGRAIVTDAVTSSVRGLSYAVLPQDDACHSGEKIFKVSITGWRYSVRHDSTDFDVLSFTICAPSNKRNKPQDYISNIKVNMRNLKSCARSANRSLMAALFIIKQIEKGQVPDTSRVLRLYKIHPSQHSLYDMDIKRVPTNKLKAGTLFGNIFKD